MYTRISPDELVHKASKLDATYWGSVVNNSKNIQTALPRHADKVTGGDLFQALYQWDPEILEENPDPALVAWIKRTINTDAFKELRTTTVGNRDLSAGASVTLFRELMRPVESTFKVIQQTKHSIDQMEAMMVDGPMADQVKETIKQAQEKLAENISTDDTKYGDSFNAMKESSVISLAITNSNEIVQVAQDLAEFDTPGSGYSLGGAASGQVLEQLDSQLVARITSGDSLRKIFQIAGRMKIILQQAKSRKPRQAPTPVSIAVGRDLSNVISSELGALSDPDTEDKFFAKYLDGALLQYDHKSRVNEGLGPFICLMDMSGSMSGQPLQVAQALYVSLAKMAVEKKRKIVFVPFASYAPESYYITSSKDLVNSLTKSYKVGTGTNFDSPLALAREVINTEVVYKNADVVLITDGISYLDDDWVEDYIQAKKTLGFRLVGLNVNGNMWQENQLPMFDAVAHMENGNLSNLDWMHELADSLV